MKQPLVSILVITMNELPCLKTMLASLKKQKYKNFEIIICDNNSDDGTREFAKKNSLKYVNSGGNIGTAVFNLGLPHVRGEYIFFIATDMQIAPDCLSKLVEDLETDQTCAQVVPRIMQMEDKTKLDFNGSWLSLAFYASVLKGSQTTGITQIPYYGPGLIRAKAVSEIGGYIYEPSYFLYGEDVDLGLRIAMRGLKVKLDSSAIIYHGGSQSKRLWTRPQLLFFRERNMLVNLLKDMQLSTLLFVLPYAMFIRLLVFARDLIRLDLTTAIVRLKVLGWIVMHFGEILSLRAKTQKLRLVSDSKFLHIFTEKPLVKMFLGR